MPSEWNSEASIFFLSVFNFHILHVYCTVFPNDAEVCAPLIVTYIPLRREAVVKSFYLLLDAISSGPLMSLSIQSYFRWHYLFTFWQYYRINMLLTFQFIIMTGNKSPIFTKSVIMGLNNISPWPCPLCIVRLPCVITWLYSTPLLIMRAVGVMVCLLLRKANFPGSRRTQFSVVLVIFFYCYHCFVLFALFFTQWLIYSFSFHIESIDCLI